MKEFLNIQCKNLFLWSPFVMAFGAALYFSCGTEPNFRFPILITILLVAIIYKNKNIFIRAIALFLFGFFYAMSFTHIIDTPKVKDSFGAVPISGTIKDIDYTTDKTNLIIQIPSEQIQSKTNHKYTTIRISVSNDNKNINIGDTITGNARIFHPSSRYTPVDFNFATWAYFSNISATGFFEDYKINPTNSAPNIRNFIHNKSNSFLTDSLVLGYKKTIPEKESNIWKSVGIGHVWSISGFHMTLVGGWFFAIFYLIFRLFPTITRRIPAKYPALICAWVGLLLYLFVSGISVATTRAFLMTTFIFAAVILGRGILSLRNAALAFLIIFLINPFAVMNAGFQLSFAAIFGLLWFFKDKEYIKRNFIMRILHILYLSLITAIIATLFTMPFIIAHFGYIPLYGLIGNIVLLPIFSVIIMPLVMIGTICALFNCYFLLNLVHDIYQFALSVATHITNLPYANIHMPSVSNSVLILCIIGLVCLILIVKPDSKNYFLKHINYFVCGVCIAVAIILNITTPRPLFYASSDHELVAFNVDNKLEFNHAKMAKHYFAFSSWYEFNNEEKPDKNKRYKCDHGLCRYDSKNWNLVYIQKFTAILNTIDDVCHDKSVDYIVATFEIEAPNCHAKILNGGLIIYPNGHITKIINQRPWDNLPQ